jgi:tyrosyl-tRNA synthetase
MHIAQGLLRAINVNKMVDAGGIFIFWVADYFAMLNGKFDGDLEKIRTVGKYFIEVWKAAGMKMSNVKFLWASEEINKRSN